MKTPSITSSNKYPLLVLAFFYIFFSPRVCAQVPQGIPKETGPIDFSSPANVVIYIVLPIIIIIGIFIWRAAVKRRKKENENDL